MEKQSQDHALRQCRHFLRLRLRNGKDGLVVLARCRYCPRTWFVGSQAEVLSGLTQIEGRAS